MDKLLWWETCPHRSCPSWRFKSPLHRERHLILDHDAHAPAFGPVTEEGHCPDPQCPTCGGPA